MTTVIDAYYAPGDGPSTSCALSLRKAKRQADGSDMLGAWHTVGDQEISALVLSLPPKACG